ncbi:YtxH domain-containing protein [Marinilactibacillus psychrotolerans]|uniref:YtxH domain-containing protein n=1 Tax=Marinilactibacillus psychrotolerans TaxID=191770 RepID=A0A5R9C472_9LACT|nr:YtxH domain-containing protein [Marinilactibacillus psychrotolerans]TLQ07622.1 YtxH domain-containing protein [Marinilactibacillus psychrotolerans]
MNKQSKSEGFLLGTIVGAAIAGVSALLFAPKSGKELREDITQHSNRTKGQLKDYADLAKEKGAELKETAQKASSEYVDTAKKTYGQMTESLNNSKDEQKNTLNDIKKEAASMAEEAKNAVNGGTKKENNLNNHTGIGTEEAKSRTMSFDYDEKKMTESESKSQKTENTSTEQTTEDGKDDKGTTNTNVGI